MYKVIDLQIFKELRVSGILLDRKLQEYHFKNLVHHTIEPRPPIRQADALVGKP